jgi:hypothetical protein
MVAQRPNRKLCDQLQPQKNAWSDAATPFASPRDGRLGHRQHLRLMLDVQLADNPRRMPSCCPLSSEAERMRWCFSCRTRAVRRRVSSRRVTNDRTRPSLGQAGHGRPCPRVEKVRPDHVGLGSLRSGARTLGRSEPKTGLDGLNHMYGPETTTMVRIFDAPRERERPGPIKN